MYNYTPMHKCANCDTQIFIDEKLCNYCLINEDIYNDAVKKCGGNEEKLNCL